MGDEEVDPGPDALGAGAVPHVDARVTAEVSEQREGEHVERAVVERARASGLLWLAAVRLELRHDPARRCGGERVGRELRATREERGAHELRVVPGAGGVRRTALPLALPASGQPVGELAAPR